MIQMDNESHHPKLAQFIALIDTSALSINPATSTSSMILDILFPAREACPADSANNIFGRLFGIHLQNQ